jgi:Protein of unknown function (DUF3300)
MSKLLAVSFTLLLFDFVCFPLICSSAAHPVALASLRLQQDQQDQNYPGDQGYQEYVPYSPEQLDNLLGPIALYPDPLLAQVLPAATFPDEIDNAARYVRAYGENGVDEQNWDVSVRAVAHYPEVLDMMEEKLDWTTAIGQAYVNQSTEVMESIQRLRRLAYDQGNLETNPQWQIVDQDNYIQIWPASPEYIYVPTYDPASIYYRRCYYNGGFSFGFAFGTGFHIGIWLNRDTDWRNRRIYYTGWRGDEDWERRARPYVERQDRRVRNVYINNSVNVTNVRVDRTVVNRTVNVQNINRYNSVHRNVNFNHAGRNRGAARPGQPQVNNRVINSNIDTSDPRLNQFRGHHQSAMPARPQEYVRPPERTRPGYQQWPNGPTRTYPPPRRSSQPRQFQPQPRPQEQPRPQFQPQARPPQQFRPSPAIENGGHTFGRSESTFNPREAQQRGAQSRQQMSRPSRPALSRPAPSRPHAQGGRR